MQLAANTASACFALEPRSPWKSALTASAASVTADTSIWNGGAVAAGDWTPCSDCCTLVIASATALRTTALGVADVVAETRNG